MSRQEWKETAKRERIAAALDFYELRRKHKARRLARNLDETLEGLNGAGAAVHALISKPEPEPA